MASHASIRASRFLRPNPAGWTLALMLLFAGTAGTAGAATYSVDNQNPSATDAGAGTQATPYVESVDGPSAMDLWALVSGNVWLASNVSADPEQAPAQDPASRFAWDSGQGF